MMITRRGFARTLILLFVLTAAAWTVSNWLFVKRYASYVWNDYTPLTVPISWYEPLAALAHGSGASLPESETDDIPREILAKADEYAQSQKSIALLIAHKGKLVHERYWEGFKRDELFNPQSMSKTVLAMLVGIAIADGDIASVNEPVGKWLTDWGDDPRGQITIRNLLQMSGGLAQISTDYRPVPWSKGVWQHFGMNFNKGALALQLVDEPGTKYDYNNNENNLLGLVLERATGKRYQDYLGEKLWQPMNLGPAFMYLDRPGGNVMKSCCILSRPIDWIKLGQLFLNDGQIDGKQIVPAQWLDEMVKPAETWNGYGYQIWLNSDGIKQISKDPPAPGVYTWWASEPYAAETVYHFVGHGYQSVWVIPEHDLVIVRATRKWNTEYYDTARIPNLIVRGVIKS